MEASREGGAGADEAPLTGLLVLVSGPIASGKSTLSTAVADRLRRAGTAAAAVDVDLVYELLEERGHSPGDPAVWRRAHRLAGRIAAALFAEGVDVVVVEGDFLTSRSQDELLAAAGARSVRRITLRTSLEAALTRVQLDDTRGISRDPRFLAGHYEQVAPAVARRPDDELVLDTEALTVEETVDRVVAWL